MVKVLLTGHTRGIGKATFEALTEAGFEVVGASSSTGTNVANRQDVEVLPKDIDILINNAAMALYKQIEDVTAEEYDRLFAVNMGGVFNTTMHVLPYMKRQNSGLIINVASKWGEVGASCESIYAATKGAVIAFCKSLDKEFQFSGIKITYLSPEAVDTDMLSECPYGTEKAVPPEEIAKEIVSICEEFRTSLGKKS
jgi:Short-chain alcohol dehydrogenase of unknown specificity